MIIKATDNISNINSSNSSKIKSMLGMLEEVGQESQADIMRVMPNTNSGSNNNCKIQNISSMKEEKIGTCMQKWKN
jgi:hypothetical protein